jgi:hypothetical protein
VGSNMGSSFRQRAKGGDRSDAESRGL